MNFSKSFKIIIAAISFFIAGIIVAGASTNTAYASQILQAQNPNNPHLDTVYTANSAEHSNLIHAGWMNFGVAWNTPDSGTGVYRVYNPNAGTHFFTTNVAEVNNLVAAGWNNEGVKFHAGGGVKVYRLYQARTGNRQYSTNSNVISTLVAHGYTNEGVAFYVNSSSQGAMPLY